MLERSGICNIFFTFSMKMCIAIIMPDDYSSNMDFDFRHGPSQGTTFMAKSPGSYIQEELKRRGWTQTEFALIIDRPIQVVNEIIKGKRAVTIDTAAALGASIGPDAATWMNREAEYRLAQATFDTAPVEKRVRLYDMAPVREMEKRQWISATKDSASLEAELMRFFGVQSMDTEPQIAAAMRRAGSGNDPLTPSQRAWCFRVRQIGSSVLAAEYKEECLGACFKSLRRIAAFPQEAHKVPTTLAKYGIRFVIVEPLPGSKVDGVALWQDDQPIIGLSARFDRIDNFWFTLFHELSHVKHRDEPHLDVYDHSTEDLLEVKSPIEQRADDEAAASLVPRDELESFILRVGPLYSKDRIVRFANRIQMHPGVIVGQLQKRGEIGWSANREMLAKIRKFVVPAAITDGWGMSIDPRSL